MLQAFVDESEQRELKIFAAGILLIKCENIIPLTNDLEKLSRDMTDQIEEGDKPDFSLELHGYEILQRKRGWEKFATWQRIWVYNKAVELIDQKIEKFIIKPINYENLRIRDPHEISMSYGLERVQDIAAHQNIEKVKITADKKPESEKMLQDALNGVKIFGTGGYRSSDLKRLDKEISFVDSKDSRLIQACDLILYILMRNMLENKKGGEDSSAKETRKICEKITKKCILDIFPK